VSSLGLVREGTQLLGTRAAALLDAGHQVPVRVLVLASWFPACVWIEIGLRPSGQPQDLGDV
jgi:hypothetical protein